MKTYLDYTDASSKKNTYHYCVHFEGDWDDEFSREDDVEANNIEEVKQLIKNMDDFPRMSYWTIEGNGEWFSSEE